MKIACIFEKQLYSFHYDEFDQNEYERKFDQWTNLEYIYKFAKANKITDIESYADQIIENVEEIEDFIEEIRKTHGQFKQLFIPLDNKETNRILSLRKGKITNNDIRIYAIKVPEEFYVITGGAIKMSQKMQEHPCTNKELIKLYNAKTFLELNGNTNEDAFLELIAEL